LLEGSRLPLIIGHDFAGVVSATGSGVRDFKTGDRVFGFTLGAATAAEFLRLHSGVKYTLAKIPDAMSFVEAASFPTVALTVIESLRRAEAELGGPGSLKDKTILVPAGLCGVGSLAVQALKGIYSAKKVITTVSRSKIPLIPELLGTGVVDQVVDYTLGPAHVIEAIGKGTVDMVLDTAFMAMSYLPLLKPGTGMLLTITGKSGKILKGDWPEIGWWLVVAVDMLDWWYRWRAGRWNVKYDNVFVKANGADLETLVGWLVEGKVKPVIGKVVGWEDLEGVRALCQLIYDRKGGVGKYVMDLE
jgi:NADPH:quinone reductase-like Zn-dependent oxidoreductase